MTNIGYIKVTEKGITVAHEEDQCSVETFFPNPSRETLEYATNLLASWMNLPFEDAKRECQRIHAKDQRDALIKECLDDFLNGEEL